MKLIMENKRKESDQINILIYVFLNSSSNLGIMDGGFIFKI